MSEAFDALPWHTRWWSHAKMAMPKWYQNWHGRRQFWKYADKGAQGGSDGRDYLIRMFACAELNRRNGDKSLYEILEKHCPGWKVEEKLPADTRWPHSGQVTLEQFRVVEDDPFVTLRRYWVDNTASNKKRMPWE
jgi:hypothetical protein